MCILNGPNLSDAKVNALLQMAGKKLGRDPDALRQQLEAGQLDSVLGKLSPEVRNQANSLLSDPKKLEELMANDNVKNLLSGLMGGKK